MAIKLDGEDASDGKKNEAETMLRNIQFLAGKIIDMKKNIDAEINKRTEVNYTTSEEYEDLLHKLENEVRHRIKVFISHGMPINQNLYRWKKN